MANIHCSDYDCNRRDLLKLGGKGVVLGAMGMSLPQLLYMREANAQVNLVDPLFDAVLYVYFSGGPSMCDVTNVIRDTNAPNSRFNTISLNVNDANGNPMVISEALPNIANAVNNDPMVSWASLRTMDHGTNNHGNGRAIMGSWLSGARINLYPAIAPKMAYMFEGTGLGVPAVLIDGNLPNGPNDVRGARLPTALTVDPGNGAGNNPVVQALELPVGVDQARYSRRKAMLDKLNAKFLADNPDEMLRTYQKATNDAYDVTFKGDAARAFDLTGKTLLPGQDNGFRQRITLSQELLVAGVPFVTMGIGGNDSHGNNTQTIGRNWTNNLDAAMPDFITNIKNSGKRVLMIVEGDFSRTPDGKGNENDGNANGRDHWGDETCGVGMLAINQPKFRTTGVGDDGPRGLNTFTSNRRNGIPNTAANPAGFDASPLIPEDLGYVVFRSLGLPVYAPDGSGDLPSALREAPPTGDTRTRLPTHQLPLWNALIAP